MRLTSVYGLVWLFVLICTILPHVSCAVEWHMTPKDQVQYSSTKTNIWNRLIDDAEAHFPSNQARYAHAFKATHLGEFVHNGDTMHALVWEMGSGTHNPRYGALLLPYVLRNNHGEPLVLVAPQRQYERQMQINYNDGPAVSVNPFTGVPVPVKLFPHGVAVPDRPGQPDYNSRHKLPRGDANKVNVEHLTIYSPGEWHLGECPQHINDAGGMNHDITYEQTIAERRAHGPAYLRREANRPFFGGNGISNMEGAVPLNPELAQGRPFAQNRAVLNSRFSRAWYNIRYWYAGVAWRFQNWRNNGYRLVP